MTYDPRKRDSTWTMVLPGLYLDPKGAGHIFPDEICAELDIEYTEENHNFILTVFKKMAEEDGMRFVELEHTRGES